VAQLPKKLELLFTWLVTRIFRHFAGRDIGRLEPFSLRAGENSRSIQNQESTPNPPQTPGPRGPNLPLIFVSRVAKPQCRPSNCPSPVSCHL
jgi:hypothetical protein